MTITQSTVVKTRAFADGADDSFINAVAFERLEPVSSFDVGDLSPGLQGAYYEGYSGEPTPFIPYPGTGEISGDPLFVDPFGGDYSLFWDSPCVDAGDPTYDIPLGGGCRIDMGAYEYWKGFNCWKNNQPVKW